MGCGETESGASQWFVEVFGESEEGTFRGFKLEDPLGEVREKETLPLKTDDEFGLVYQLQTGLGDRAVIEYMSRMGDPRMVNAIILNVFLPDEGMASRRYNETEAWLRQRHGVPDGSFGDFQWRDRDRQLDIALRLLSDKKSFSLNFAPLQGL